ncbi:MarR family winged helix-turn-helix transcriptional regulator [Paenibacillus chartarius]|uniref:MarR family winged helix-turn-helix transcriptional regulator n=1 Tax=Paenibacillus chartarius TaxID=747481 RepID=A0ABV6DQ68_9BACL
MNESIASNSQATPLAGQVMEMLIKTTHRLHLQFESHLATYDIPEYLTGPRLRFLVTVSEAGKIRMSDMAVKCGIAPRTVTQFVDALEQEKLLVRVTDPYDRRATLLQLTDTAAPLIAKARAAMSESAEKVLAALPAEERSQLFEILHKLAATSTTAE